jgi:parvulin-like peptidyl-prolyl isomerase
MFREVGETKDISLDEMIEHYQKHIDDFQVPTRARWEQVTIRFDRVPTKFEAGEAISKMGNELFFGAPFKAVAQRSSHGPNAEEGGYYDWKQWGDFSISREINEAVFSLPPGELSGIIEDAEGLHIVRVIERQQEHVIPFSDAQVAIKQDIQAERRTKEIGAYLAKLQEQIPIWTIYDPPDTEQIANPPGGRNSFSR